MAGMQRAGGDRRASSAALWASLGTAALFEALAIPELDDKAAWTISPWKLDPYHTAVYLAQFAVPALALLIALRLLVLAVTRGADRQQQIEDRLQQIVRAAAVMTAGTGLALAFEWAAVIAGANPSHRAWTAIQVSGLAVDSALAVGTTALLVRCRRPRGSPAQWQYDWLDDLIFLCHRVRVLRRWASPEVATWVRRHAFGVFLAASALGAMAITGAQVVGEDITDPPLIAWYFIVETGSNLALCLIGNKLFVCIARPPRTQRRMITETAVVAGNLVTLATIAFHGSLATAVGLFALTLGAGLAAALITAAFLFARTASTQSSPPGKTAETAQRAHSARRPASR